MYIKIICIYLIIIVHPHNKRVITYYVIIARTHTYTQFQIGIIGTLPSTNNNCTFSVKVGAFRDLKLRYINHIQIECCEIRKRNDRIGNLYL